ncbi:MAG: redoxin family protein [Rhodothermales bacterium]|nr:redoxin family protein [Rhodothermales bacterium]
MRRYSRLFFVLALFGLAAAPAAAQELPLGTVLPMQDARVTLVDGSGKTIGALTGTGGTLFIFWSNQCAWVDKYRSRVDELHDAFGGRGVSFVAVNANDASAFPQEAPAEGVQQHLAFDYFIDAGAGFANAIGATRQPHVFLFDKDRRLVYTGSIDDSPGDPANVQKRYLHDALTQMLGGQPIGVAKTKAFGCTIRFPNPGG